MTFDCERCGRQCRDNFNLTKHLNRKNPCSIQQIIVQPQLPQETFTKQERIDLLVQLATALTR